MNGSPAPHGQAAGSASRDGYVTRMLGAYTSRIVKLDHEVRAVLSMPWFAPRDGSAQFAQRILGMLRPGRRVRALYANTLNKGSP